jgi:hypothetical protein
MRFCSVTKVGVVDTLVTSVAHVDYVGMLGDVLWAEIVNTKEEHKLRFF